MFFFFKQKTAYEMRISDWSSDVCSSDLCRTARDCSRCARAVDSGHWRISCDHGVRARGQRQNNGHALLGRRIAKDRPASVMARGTCGHFGHAILDRKSVVEGKSGSVRVDPGGGRIIKKKTKKK